MPWRVTFRLDRLLNTSSRDDQRIAVAFAPGAGRFRPAPGQGLDDVPEKPGMGPADVAEENRRRRAEGARTVFLPVRLFGLIPDSRLLADRSEVTVIDRGGRTLYQGTGNDLELRATGADAIVHQGVRVPGALFSRAKGDLVDVRLDYSFTLFRAGATYALPARGGDQRMPGIGWCVTKVDDAGTRVRFQCLQPGERPSCLAVCWSTPQQDNVIRKSRSALPTIRRIQGTRCRTRSVDLAADCLSTIPRGWSATRSAGPRCPRPPSP